VRQLSSQIGEKLLRISEVLGDVAEICHGTPVYDLRLDFVAI